MPPKHDNEEANFVLTIMVCLNLSLARIVNTAPVSVFVNEYIYMNNVWKSHMPKDFESERNHAAHLVNALGCRSCR